MEYTAFNTTDSQDLVVEAGDIIHGEIVAEDGHLSYKIQKEGEEPIAESENIFFSEEFDVEVEESGTYTVTVTGKKAKGSVKFVVEHAESWIGTDRQILIEGMVQYEEKYLSVIDVCPHRCGIHR